MPTASNGSSVKAARSRSNGQKAASVGAADTSLSTNPPVVAAYQPSTEEIARRAYEIYEREGRLDGRDLENWHRAEAELIAERK